VSAQRETSRRCDGTFDHYYDIVIDDSEILHCYAEEYPHERILGNHKDQYLTKHPRLAVSAA